MDQILALPVITYGTELRVPILHSLTIERHIHTLAMTSCWVIWISLLHYTLTLGLAMKLVLANEILAHETKRYLQFGLPFCAMIPCEKNVS